MSFLLQSIIIYILYVLSYILLFFAIHRKAAIRWWVLPFGMAVCAVYSVYTSTAGWFFIALLAILTGFFSIIRPWKDALYYFVIVYLLEECVSGFWYSILFIVNISPLSEFTERLAVRIAVLLSYLFIILLRKKTTPFAWWKKSATESIVKRLYYLMIVMSTGILLSNTVLRVLLPTVASTRARIIVTILILVSYISIGGVVLLYAMVSFSNQRMNEMLQQEQMANEMLQHYYTMLLDKESDTKKFRHDIQNHMLALQQLIMMKKQDDALSYLRSMQTSYTELSSRVSITGNALVDAVSNYYRDFLPDPDIIQFEGLLPEELPCDAYQYNIIYSNILQNAVEAVLSQQEPGDSRHITVAFLIRKHFFYTTVQNSYCPKIPKRHLHNETSPSLHGHGIDNVNRAVNELSAMMSISNDDNSYSVKISIPVTN